MLGRSVIITSLITAIICEISVGKDQVVCGGVVHWDITDVENVGDAWFDVNKCMSYECIVSGGQPGVRQHSCSELDVGVTDPKCKMVKGTGLFPNCCYGPIKCED